MEALNLPAIAVILALLPVFYELIPAPHWSYHIAPFWLWWAKLTHRENRLVYQNHMAKGKALRLSPGLASISRGFPKTEFYFRGFTNDNTENIFTFEDNAEHSARKRVISGIFSKFFILADATSRCSMKKILFGRLLSRNLTENQKERRLYLDGFFAAAPYTFWQYEIGLIPKKVDSGFHDIEQWNLEKCDKAQQLTAQGEDSLSDDDKPVVMALVLKAISGPYAKPGQYPQWLKIASDMFAHNSVAHETSGNTLAFCLAVGSPLSFAPRAGEEWKLPTAKSIDQLPLLEAVILKSVRLYPSAAGGQPRRVPKSCSPGGCDGILAGTIVQCYAYSLHRTPDIFPEPHKWEPERWIESGGRMCIGINFAYFSMKNVIGSIYTNFTTTLHDHGSMELEDAYLAGPEGHRLGLKFKLIET
ncbi:cytochrome P450 [Fusarium oxysporum Fo47]|uniref:cytochrome P450 n=1 Tax=Fusarium oxysporum Fo47 TaxID=660027 RepID=UPI002869D15C|nr:cytochrome P450 [Fusarium oxysporum Fo47]QKD56843.2 cytochrome P450 [Fusarium oxysporum Fo47]